MTVLINFDPAECAMTGDGNSIMDKNHSDLLPQLAALPPISGKLVITNLGISGQTTRNMSIGSSDVDAAYVNGKTNILFAWEYTNDIHNGAGQTGAQAITNMVNYVAARQAYVANNRPGQKPWVVITMTVLPRGSHLNAWTAPQGEAHAQYVNSYIRANYEAMGFAAYVEARRPGGPFDFTDVSNLANFPSSLWTDPTHPNSTGKGILASYIADTLTAFTAGGGSRAARLRISNGMMRLRNGVAAVTLAGG